MSILFPLGIPLYYVLALYKVRGAINTPLPSILKDKDYITAFALAGHKFIDNEGKQMSGEQLSTARKVVKSDWVQRNPELAASLEGKDYKSQYEQMRKRAGFKKAKAFIKRKARASSVPAHRFKFLWVSVLGTEFEILCCVSTLILFCESFAGPLQSKLMVFRGA
jgi:hypothetical protein